MPQASPPALAGGSTPTTIRVKKPRRRKRRPRRLDHLPRPQGARQIVEQLPLQLLPPEAGAGIDFLHRRSEILRAVGVVGGPAAGADHARKPNRIRFSAGTGAGWW